MRIATAHTVIDRDVMTKISKEVWAWELPVLESKFPGGLTVVVGKSFSEREKLPDAAMEYERLGRMYGIEAERKVPHVEMIYGRGSAGLESLEKAIRKSANGAWEEPEPEEVQFDDSGGEPDDPLG
jgi:hypothetical protein